MENVKRGQLSQEIEDIRTVVFLLQSRYNRGKTPEHFALSRWRDFARRANPDIPIAGADRKLERYWRFAERLIAGVNPQSTSRKAFAAGDYREQAAVKRPN